MVKIHLWKSELALILTALESQDSKRKISSAEQDLHKDVTRKIQKAYNTAER